MGEIIKYRHNVLHVSSIESFANIRGKVHPEYKDVYFVRVLGFHQGLIDEIHDMDRKLTAQMQAGRLFYNRIHTLPRLAGLQETAYYCGCYDKWTADKQAGIQTKADAAHAVPARQLGAACEAVIGQYGQGRPVTESMKKNFAVKLLYWFDFVFSGMQGRWDADRSLKIAADNVVKEQEYLFYYMLTLVGCDVLLLQSGQDIAKEEKRKRLSEEIVVGSFHPQKIPELTDAQTGNQTGAHGPKSDAGQPAQTGEETAGITVKIPKRIRQKNRPEQSHAVQPQNQPQTLERAERHQSRPNVRMPRDWQESQAQAANMGKQSGNGFSAKEKSFEELAMLASSIVQIAVHDQGGEVVATGSGIMVGKDGYLLTNNHVAVGGCSYSVRIEDDPMVYHTDELIKYHPVLDLAILRIRRELVPLTIYRGQEKLARGQSVAAIGSPLGMFNSISNGIISGFRKVNGVDMIQFTAPISHGSSGGALLNMQGEVIGISTAGFDEGQNINLAVGYESIRLFIRGFV